MIKVFGHLTPDTDTVVSAIAYAWFLNQTGTEATPYVLGSLNKETAFVLDHFKVSKPELLESLAEGETVSIVDTNNPGELPETLANATIHSIVDHHKLAGLVTAEPLAITMRPFACTATIIKQSMDAMGVVPSKEVAGLMVAAILSDTLNFTSPTTTDVDRKVAGDLATLAGVDTDALAADMFAAKSDLTGISPKEILVMDSKVFDMGGKKVRVSSLETTDPKQALALETELLEAAQAQKQEEGLDALFFFIVDIVNTSATLLLASDYEKEIATKAFEKPANGNNVSLPGVVSRKKQMVPPIERAIG